MLHGPREIMQSTHDTSPRAIAPVLDRFSIPLSVTIRLGTEADLAPLEWDQQLASHRALLAQAYRRYERGEALFLVAETARIPIGQLWIDLTRGGAGAARLWAFRVLPCLRGLGIGTRLLRAAEQSMAARDLRIAETGCDKREARARRFYEERGYGLSHEELDRYTYETPWGERVEATSDMWILRKRLARDAGAAGSPRW